MYRQSKEDTGNIDKFGKINEDMTFNLTIEIETLKAQIVKLNEENCNKINKFAKSLIARAKSTSERHKYWLFEILARIKKWMMLKQQ